MKKQEPAPAESVAVLLAQCEDGVMAPRYEVSPLTYAAEKRPWYRPSVPARTVPLRYDARGMEVFVVSDLHIGPGRNESGEYPGTENFFADESFERFLRYAARGAKNALLVINGDIFDFIRITVYPGKRKTIRKSEKIRSLLRGTLLRDPARPAPRAIMDEYDEWIGELAKIGIQKSRRELEADVAAESGYGLGTEDFKTVYKLIRIRRGHPRFFTALAQWLEEGHRLLFLKGNHDLELYWKAVRNYIRLSIAETIAAGKPAPDIGAILRTIVLPRLTFIDDAVEIDGDVYIEHGHRYDKFTMVLGGPVLEDEPEKINLPFGSFFNRYVINRVELFYPFLDNVRPSTAILPVLVRENFPLALRVIIQHIPALGRVLFKNMRYVRFMLQRVFWYVLAVAIPLIVAAAMNLGPLRDALARARGLSGIAGFLVTQAKNLGLLILPYLLSRLIAWAQLAEPSRLDEYARARRRGTGYRIMTMGHTHNPGEQVIEDGCRFYNTGTWTPVIEISSAEVREDRTYTFLRLIRDEQGNLQPGNGGLLERWNDDAGRGDPLAIVERK